MFRDRDEAAEKLADRLMGYRKQHPLVLAIPRGSVSMAKRIATRLDGDFDVVLVRKLRAPFNPEFAIGSIDESGWSHIEEYAASVGGTPDYLAEEIQTQLTTLRKRRAQYTPVRPPIDPAGRVVIVIDDGLATGSTMIAALHGLRARHPAKLICAVPVSPADTLVKVRQYADEVVCLEVPEYFQAVGQFYLDFPQVEDEEVIALMAHTDPAAARKHQACIR